MHEKMQASGLSEFIAFIYSSAICGHIQFFCSPEEVVDGYSLHSPSSSAITIGGVAASIGSQFGETLFMFGGQKLLMGVTFIVY